MAEDRDAVVGREAVAPEAVGRDFMEQLDVQHEAGCRARCCAALVSLSHSQQISKKIVNNLRSAVVAIPPLWKLTGNRRLLYSAYTQTTGCADNKELRWNAPR